MGMPATDITALTSYGPGPEVAVTSVKRRRLRFIANRKTATGLIILAFFALLALIGPWIAPFDPSGRSKELLEAPSAKHWFGTTHLDSASITTPCSRALANLSAQVPNRKQNFRIG